MLNASTASPLSHYVSHGIAWQVWGFLGSTAAVLLGLTFPCVAYVRLRRTPSTRESSVPQRKAVAWLIIVGSVLVIPACLVVATSEAIGRFARAHARNVTSW